MNFTCQREHLLNYIQIVQKAVATKSTMPILGGIYLKAENGVLELQANDYETAIKCSLPAQVVSAGATVLAAKYFSEIIRRLPGDTVEISAAENKSIKIKSKRSQYDLVCMPYEDFPLIQSLQSGSVYTIPENTMKNLIQRTTFACSQDDTRPVFTGVLIEIENETINFVATNTHRLAFCTDIIENPERNELKVIVPAKFLNELNKIFSADTEEPVSIRWHQNKLAFEFKDIYMETQLIEGKFPNYQQVIPKSFKTNVFVQISGLTESVERASLLTRDGDYNVVKMDIKDTEINITSNNPDVGAAYEETEARINGEQLTIAFNARYILDALKVINSPEIEFSFTSPLTPAVIKPVEQAVFMYVITPVRTN